MGQVHKMKGIQMYTKIQEMKAQGFSQNRTANYLNIHRDTVNRYWNMTADEYREYSEKIKRISVLESYRTVIESWIHKYPCISAAQICDWLKEDYSEDFKERTVSRFVKGLREQLGIPKSSPPREYTAVAETSDETTVLGQRYGAGKLYRFFSQTGEELEWTLLGGRASMLEMTLTVTGGAWDRLCHGNRRAGRACGALCRRDGGRDPQRRGLRPRSTRIYIGGRIMNEFIRILCDRRSCRSYRPTQLREEELTDILRAGTYAASGMGRQSAKIVVLQDPKDIARLERMNAEVLGKPDAHPFYGAPTVCLVLARADVGLDVSLRDEIGRGVAGRAAGLDEPAGQVGRGIGLVEDLDPSAVHPVVVLEVAFVFGEYFVDEQLAVGLPLSARRT